MITSNKIIKPLLIATVLSLAACDGGVQHMGPTEYGVRFRRLPGFLGGGVCSPSGVASPLETVAQMPWEDIYRFDVSPQYLTWGRDSKSDEQPSPDNDDVHTRVKDGNEAALRISLRYRIKPDPESLVKLAQEVTPNNEGVKELVVAVVRSEIRTYMNRLRTSEFRDDKKRNETADAARDAAAERLAKWGIELEAINLRQYRFVRLRPDSTEDTSYQDRLREIQEKEQDIEGERSRVETVKAKKQKEFLEAQSLYNRRLAEAKGYKEQAMYAADAYYTARSNEAQAILAEGKSEVEGLSQQIAALSGSGGRALLKLEVADQIGKADPKFITLPDKNAPGQGISVNRTDTNDLLRQLGIVEAATSSDKGRGNQKSDEGK